MAATPGEILDPDNSFRGASYPDQITPPVVCQMIDVLKDLQGRIEHSALKSEVTEKDVRVLCREAQEYGFYSVVVNPVWVRSAGKYLENTGIKICSAVGFPLGANRSEIKIAEAVSACRDGAAEIDMVANIGWLVCDRFSDVEREIRLVREALASSIVLKVIIEAGTLTRRQQLEATRAVIAGGSQFVKTGTGFKGEVTLEQVTTLFEAAGGQIEIKAAGGIRNLADCEALLRAGAARLGCSASVGIMKELHSRT